MLRCCGRNLSRKPPAGFGNTEEAVDIGVLAGIATGVFCVFRVEGQAFGRSAGVDRTMLDEQMMVDAREPCCPGLFSMLPALIPVESIRSSRAICWTDASDLRLSLNAMMGLIVGVVFDVAYRTRVSCRFCWAA